MSTGIEIVASVIGVAGAGFKLSLILNAIGCEIANAPYEIKAISKSVTLYSLLLKQTAAVLESADPVHSPEAIKTTEQVLDESNAVFGDINAMLNKVQTRQPDGSVSPTIRQRFRWCFKKHGIEYLLGRMDRLQMSLSLMLQIIQLGSTMGSTSRHDPPARVEKMMNQIQRERVEAQTVVIQYFQENQALDRLYMAAMEEAQEPSSPIEYRKEDSDALTIVSSNESQVEKLDKASVNSEQSIIVSPYKHILTGLGENWNKLGESKEDMVKRSEEIINQLLERWTLWRQKREQQPRQSRSQQSGRYKPVVRDWHEEDNSFFDRYADREDSPGGKYLEGPTTDWRQPHSQEARRDARRRRKAYEAYQASVEGSSDVDSPSSNASKKKASTKHAVDSDSETPSSEEEKVPEKPGLPRRRSSAVAIPSEQRSKYHDDPLPASRSYNPSATGSQPQPSMNSGVPRTPLQPPFNPHQPHRERTYPAPDQQQQQRPYPAPDQNKQHHSFSTPPQLYGHNNVPYQTMSPISQSGPLTPGLHPQQAGQSYPFPQATSQPQQGGTVHSQPRGETYPFPQPQGPPPRYVPRLSPQNSSRQAHPQRPVSRDGPARPKSRDGRPNEPSRLSREYTTADYKAYEEEKRRQTYTTADYKAYEEEKKRQKKEKRRELSDGAAKGLLGAGGLAVLLEALDALG